VIGPKLRSALGNLTKIAVAAGVTAGLGAAALMSSPDVSSAQGQALKPQLDGPALIDALRGGGLVILIRHMSTQDAASESQTLADPACASQRNLSERGRQEARDLGAAFERLGIPVGAVLTSTYCRCVETANLAFGKATPNQDLAVFDELSPPEKEARGKLIRKLLNTAPTDGSNTVLVTHTGTLLYSFGLQTQPEGIAHVFRPAEFGNAIYLGRVTPEQWSAFAASMGAKS